jgi:hypothetical protein
VEGQTYRISPHARFEAEERGPRLVLALTCLLVGAIGIPVAVAFNRMTPHDYSWLVGFPLAFVLGALFRFLTAGPRYSVTLITEMGEVAIFQSRDHQVVICLVAALREVKTALDGARRAGLK